MHMDVRIEQRAGYAVVRLDGDPTLDEFIACLQEVGAVSVAWPIPRALFDLRSVRSLVSAPEHRSVGEAAVRHLAHLQRLASVVPADRLTRVSESTARQAGLNLRVFTCEGDAIAWLLSDGA